MNWDCHRTRLSGFVWVQMSSSDDETVIICANEFVWVQMSSSDETVKWICGFEKKKWVIYKE